MPIDIVGLTMKVIMSLYIGRYRPKPMYDSHRRAVPEHCLVHSVELGVSCTTVLAVFKQCLIECYGMKITIVTIVSLLGHNMTLIGIVIINTKQYRPIKREIIIAVHILIITI